MHRPTPIPTLIAVAAIVALAIVVATDRDHRSASASAVVAVGDQPPPGPAAQAAAGEATTNDLGGPLVEALLTPIEPCRLADTREAGGPLVPGSSRAFRVRGGLVTGQGGQAGCSIPAAARAAELTITAVDSGSGFLRAYPGDGSPLATFLNYTPVYNVSNTGTVALRDGDGIAAFDDDLRLRAYGTATHAVVDVSGYYVGQLGGDISANGALLRGEGITSAGRISQGQYEVYFRHPVAACSYVASVDADSLVDGYALVDERDGNSSGVFVQLVSEAGSSFDGEFHLAVTC